MKKLLLSTAAILLAAPAFAADLPRRVAAPAPAPVFTSAPVWGGFYVGAQAGLGKLTSKNTDVDNWYFGTRDAKTSDVGGLIGLRAGYDATFGNILAGVLVEGSFASFDSQKEYTPANPSYRVGTHISFLGSARAKLGLHSGNFAAFVTGGLAYANAEHRYNETDGTGQYIRGDARYGYVFGVGAAYALSSNLSLGLDVSRYQFSNKTHALLNPNGTLTGSRWSLQDHVDTVMVSLNYRFGGAASPVVARY